MLVIVNPRAAHGTALARWSKIRTQLPKFPGELNEVIVSDPKVARIRIREAIGDGERRFVAVGGDGTVNHLANDLVAIAPPEFLRLCTMGAIGLGSSNDFHKPVDRATTINGAPVRLDFDAAIWHDVGRTTYLGDDGSRHVHRWLVNASVGTTAMGNWIFNNARGAVGFLKSISSSLGMVGAAVAALLQCRGQRMILESDQGQTMYVAVRNLGVVKNPHFTGSLRYDSPHEPASGDFHVHLLANTSFVRTLVTLARLARGKFEGRGTSSWRGRRLRVTSHEHFAVEGDGETVLTKQVEFSLESVRLLICP